MDNFELIIQNGDNLYYPIIEDGVVWETERKGLPGKLTFNVINDGNIDFQEGNSVRLKVNGKGLFYGFVFTKKRDKNQIISVTALDQLRYFKNKDTYVYKNKTASELVKMIAADFQLQVGTIDDTGFVIESRIEDSKTLFDIAQTALDLTLQSRKKMYVLFDDFGKLSLRDIESMKLDLVVDGNSAENFSYESSIDHQTYNKIKLSYANKKAGKREIYIAQDSSSINSWGVLQHYDTIDENTNGKAKADSLLSLYNRKSRSLNINSVLGDIRVRAGSSVVVYLELGDISARNYMVVERVKHVFNNSEHLMDLKLTGGDFNA